MQNGTIFVDLGFVTEKRGTYQCNVRRKELPTYANLTLGPKMSFKYKTVPQSKDFTVKTWALQ